MVGIVGGLDSNAGTVLQFTLGMLSRIGLPSLPGHCQGQCVRPEQSQACSPSLGGWKACRVLSQLSGWMPPTGNLQATARLRCAEVRQGGGTRALAQQHPLLAGPP